MEEKVKNFLKPLKKIQKSYSYPLAKGNKKKFISVYSIPYDSVLANYKCNEQLEDHKTQMGENKNKPLVITRNQKIWEYIVKQTQKSKNIKKIILMNGSHRQSLMTDIDINSNKHNGSCFLASLAVEKHLRGLLGFFIKHNKKNIISDQFILEDLLRKNDNLKAKAFEKNIRKILNYNTIKAGRANARNQNNFIQFLDKKKASILYLQMHRAASIYSNTEIEFNFLGYENNINAIHKFFISAKDLIPKKVKLNLHKAENNNLLKSVTIQGTGNINHNYGQTITKLYNTPECIDINKQEINYDKQKKIIKVLRADQIKSLLQQKKLIQNKERKKELTKRSNANNTYRKSSIINSKATLLKRKETLLYWEEFFVGKNELKKSNTPENYYTKKNNGTNSKNSEVLMSWDDFILSRENNDKKLKTSNSQANNSKNGHNTTRKSNSKELIYKRKKVVIKQ